MSYKHAFPSFLISGTTACLCFISLMDIKIPTLKVKTTAGDIKVPIMPFHLNATQKNTVNLKHITCAAMIKENQLVNQ